MVSSGTGGGGILIQESIWLDKNVSGWVKIFLLCFAERIWLFILNVYFI